MALKAKHEQLVYDQIFSNFTIGKPINVERKYLSSINENMAFKGGPTDKKYCKKALEEGYSGLEIGRRNALRMTDKAAKSIIHGFRRGAIGGGFRKNSRPLKMTGTDS